eukprot:TRINITY_DN8399_c0_g1_i1.p1 TRINITY_DN8399_c0_g1~~TRINITY_DN8399_c0_g1_i1.p1  ORF type:complete len:1035 (-),score=297.78 TRINITY_DN8399_c0_g1_i1:1241-4135(-)
MRTLGEYQAQLEEMRARQDEGQRTLEETQAAVIVLQKKLADERRTKEAVQQAHDAVTQQLIAEQQQSHQQQVNSHQELRSLESHNPPTTSFKREDVPHVPVGNDGAVVVESALQILPPTTSPEAEGHNALRGLLAEERRNVEAARHKTQQLQQALTRAEEELRLQANLFQEQQKLWEAQKRAELERDDDDRELAVSRPLTVTPSPASTTLSSSEAGSVQASVLAQMAEEHRLERDQLLHTVQVAEAQVRALTESSETKRKTVHRLEAKLNATAKQLEAFRSSASLDTKRHHEAMTLRQQQYQEAVAVYEQERSALDAILPVDSNRTDLSLVERAQHLLEQNSQTGEQPSGELLPQQPTADSLMLEEKSHRIRQLEEQLAELLAKQQYAHAQQQDNERSLHHDEDNSGTIQCVPNDEHAAADAKIHGGSSEEAFDKANKELASQILSLQEELQQAQIIQKTLTKQLEEQTEILQQNASRYSNEKALLEQQLEEQNAAQHHVIEIQHQLEAAEARTAIAEKQLQLSAERLDSSTRDHEKQIEELRGSFDQEIAQYIQAQQKLAQHSQEVEEHLRKALTDAENSSAITIRDLRMALEQSQNHGPSASEAADTMNTTVQVLEEQLTKCQEELAGCKEELAGERAATQNTQLELSRAREALTDLKEQLLGVTNRKLAVERLLEEHAEAARKLLEETKQQLNEQLENTKAELKQSQALLSQHRESQEKAKQEDNARLTQSLAQNTAEIQELKETLGKRTKELKIRRKQEDSLRQSLEKQQQQSKEWEDKYRVREPELARLSAETDSAKRERDQARKKLRESKQLLEELTQQNAAQSKELGDAQATNDGLKSKLAKESRERSSATKAKAEAQRELAAYNNSQLETQKRTAVLSKELDAAKDKTLHLEKKVTRLTDRLAKAVQKNETDSAALVLINQQRDELQQTYNRQSEELARLHQQVSTLANAKAEMKK